MITSSVGSGWTPASPEAERPLPTKWGGTSPTEGVAHLNASTGTPKDSRTVESGWNTITPLNVRYGLAWGTAKAEDARTQSGYGTPAPKDVRVGLVWGETVPEDISLTLVYDPSPDIKDTTHLSTFMRSNEHGVLPNKPQILKDSLYMPSLALDFVFEGAAYTPATTPSAYFDFRYDKPIFAIGPIDSRVQDRWKTATIANLLTTIPWGWATPTDALLSTIAYPDTTEPITPITPPDPPTEPEVLESYMIANTTTLMVIPDGIPLFATNISVTLDIDSFSWGFSCDLVGQASLNLVRPDSTGQKYVALNINGWAWEFMVEKYSRSSKLSDNRFTITGSSRSQILAAPYAVLSSGTNASATTARQALDTAVGTTGFTINWDTTATTGVPDWALPVGALNFQDLSPLQLIAKIVVAGAGVVNPSRTDQTLNILPRYRYPVWDWTTAVMDKIIDGSVAVTLAGEWTPNPTWNSSYVSGVNTGVSLMATREGTAGEFPTEDVLDDLMSDPTINRYRAISEICKGGDQEQVTISIPLFPDSDTVPGLIVPGSLVEFREPGDTWQGLCLSVEITSTGAGASRVEQVLKFERHTSEI